MRLSISALFLLLPSLAPAVPGVDITADNDTVLKVIYTGGSPSTSHPTVVVKGKKIGIHSEANNVTGSAGVQGIGNRGVVGLAGGASDPGSGGYNVGVHGISSYTGVLAYGDYHGLVAYGTDQYGVEAHSNYIGVSAAGGSVGVEADGGSYGVAGYSGQEGGIGIYGYAVESGSYAGYFDGDVYTSGIYDGSDAGLKQNVRSLQKGLSTIMALQPRAYEMKPGISNSKVPSGTKFGLIAQDVQSILPEIVKTAKAPPKKKADGKWQKPSERQDYLALNYTALIPVLIKAMQEQQAKIEALEARLEAR